MRREAPVEALGHAGCPRDDDPRPGAVGLVAPRGDRVAIGCLDDQRITPCLVDGHEAN